MHREVMIADHRRQRGDVFNRPDIETDGEGVDELLLRG